MIGGFIGGIGVVLYVGDGITATASVTEAADTLTASAVLKLSASLNKTEAGDTLTSTCSIKLVAELSVAEAGDTMTSVSGLAATAFLSCMEDADTLSAVIELDDDLLVTFYRPRAARITLSRSVSQQVTSARSSHKIITA